jgi:hypothetical protein
MATGSVGKQAQLLFLDPVFHLAPRTINFIVKLLRGPGEVGDEETRVAPLGRVFGFHNHAPFLVPGGRGILDFAKVPRLGLAGLESLFRGHHQGLGDREQPGILRQPHEVMHAVVFAPTPPTPATKARVTPENDFNLRPGLPQPLDQEFQDRPRVAGDANISGPQIRDQQMLAAENIERQETVIAVVTV